MTHKLVFVIWEDSWSSDASATREDAIELLVCSSTRTQAG